MSYQICSALNDKIYPQQFRFVIVRDTLDVAINSKNASKMDGSAFHKAADMLKLAKRDNLYYCFEIKPKFAKLNSLLSDMTNLIQVMRSEWTDRQRQVIELYEKSENQKATATLLGITQQAVSDALQKAHREQVKRAEESVNATLEQIQVE